MPQFVLSFFPTTCCPEDIRGILYATRLGRGRVRMGFGMPALLVALTDGPNILLDKPILLLGRHPECDIQIDSRKVSRRHCCIAQVQSFLVVRDLGSTNGIRINGVRVVEGRLKPGDEFTIGSHRYQLQANEANEPVASVPRDAKSQKDVGKPICANVNDLESCDEPVALPESGQFPLAADAPPESPPLRPAREAAPPLRSAVLPEQLGLAPASRVAPPPSSPSHHPA